MCRFAEVGKCVSEGSRISSLHEHERHRRSEKDNMRRGKFAKLFALEVSNILAQPDSA